MRSRTPHTALLLLLALTACGEETSGPGTEPQVTYPWLAPGYDHMFVEARSDSVTPAFVRWQFLPLSDPTRLRFITTNDTPNRVWSKSWFLRFAGGEWQNIVCGSDPEILEDFMPPQWVAGYEYSRHDCGAIVQFKVLASGHTFVVDGERYSGYVIRSIDTRIARDIAYDVIQGPVVIEERGLEWNGEKYVFNPDAPVLRLEIQK